MKKFVREVFDYDQIYYSHSDVNLARDNFGKWMMAKCRTYSLTGEKPYEKMEFEYYGPDVTRRYLECLDELEEEVKCMKYYDLIAETLWRGSTCLNKSLELKNDGEVIEAMTKCRETLFSERNQIYDNYAKRLVRVMNFQEEINRSENKLT